MHDLDTSSRKSTCPAIKIRYGPLAAQSMQHGQPTLSSGRLTTIQTVLRPQISRYTWGKTICTRAH
eukprot:24794-Eustigmatos_ZCMA.PRE.1